MRIFCDPRFLEQGPDHPIQPVSIGRGTESGRGLYAVSSEFGQRAVRTRP